MRTKSNSSLSVKAPQLSLFPEIKKEIPITDTSVLYEYFFIISPPEATKQKIKSLKQSLHKAVSLSAYNLTVSPVSVMSFNSFSPVNDHFLDVVKNLLSGMPSFKMAFNGFDHFVHGGASNTIYAKLGDTEKITTLYKELHALLGLKPRVFTPHLTIARTIPRIHFNKSFNLINKHSFKEEFLCEQVTILERKIHHGVVSKYKVLKEIKLKS